MPILILCKTHPKYKCIINTYYFWNLALASGELSCEQTTVIKMKTNKDPEVQLIKNMDGKCPEELKCVNPEDGEGNLKGNFLSYKIYYWYLTLRLISEKYVR